ncbi:glycine betaine/proline transport system substrate-binding protein [Alkalibacterium putridalgicola]|uniref:Glycine betaine/proline transport system substrate-binding protein n=1 Tax=Alkalibacterium putridalgicola TaxID=426703 RepID=A0A1H7WJG4_9LACT|nr:glycine betaine ABC transporter substrate-binding protein [Alkalibacterium putridalgicola]GEK88545.1 glycine/betaine ABC transporter substrate-binding protein [Alkalibacterium putridalgicola]SEM21762.1 glycine betaine/proline transport system substrate-binding protein [Alkalibacterium putridalgicola]
MKMKTPIKLLSLASASLLLAACGGEDTTEDSDASIGEQLEYTITGIEPGAGITETTERALEEYDSLEGWELETSSTAGMMGQLDSAIDNEEPIIVTGWTPHYMFEMYDLKFLEDPEGVYGEAEFVHTMAREGFEEDMPEAYAILENFSWEVEDMQSIMLEAQDVDFEEAAANWIEENQDTVDSWTEGVDEVDGQEIELGSFPWDSERASSAVISQVLEEHGFEVNVNNVDPSILFQALAQGEVDVTVAPWLPTTQGAYLEEYGDEIVDMGPNMEGTVIGLVVPEYMDIDSIEDLEPAE